VFDVDPEEISNYFKWIICEVTVRYAMPLAFLYMIAKPPPLEEYTASVKTYELLPKVKTMEGKEMEDAVKHI